MEKNHSPHRGRLAYSLSALLAAALPCLANAGAWYVTNDGTDSGSCGSSRDHACRSISQAIENAGNGDVIWVGAGRYGAVNGDSGFTGPGDEHALNAGDGEVSCVVCISKALSLYSYNGTAATIIQGDANFNAVVQILSDRVVFGAKDHGFTLVGGSTGVSIDYDVIGFPGQFNGTGLQHPITVSGNLVLNAATGFNVRGQPDKPPQGCPEGAACFARGKVLLSSNTVIGGDTAFAVNNEDNFASEIDIEYNQALGARIGFGTYSNFVEIGLNVVLGTGAPTVHLRHNLASAGGVGFSAALVGSLENNVATGNSIAGFEVVPGGTTFKGNAATGNGGPGVIVSFDDPANQAVGFSTFTNNDFYGNDRARPASLPIGYPLDITTSYKPGPSAHCGVLNVGALAGTPIPDPLPAVSLNATGNFWGLASGPAAHSAADAAGGSCDQNGAVTHSKPFSATWFSFIAGPQ